MKKLGLALLSVLSLNATANPGSGTTAEVLSARFNATNEAIEVNVRFQGNSRAKFFDLEVDGCEDSVPLFCYVKLVEYGTTSKGADSSRATLSIALKGSTFAEPRFGGANLSIVGANGSSAYVTLPQ